MTLHRLSAGNGYQYLLRHTASGDVSRDGATTLVDYYASSGYPAGQWLGRGLAGLTDNKPGLAPGSVVTETQMAQLFGSGRNPVTGDPLGRPYRAFAPVQDRIARRVADLPPSLSDEQRAGAIAEIERAENQRTQPAAVAGFDLTFTVPKSASVLWGLGGPREHTAVYEAHQAAVSDVLRSIEDQALFTRTGKDGCAQVPVRGLIAAAFVHWDTRKGDPNLHSHVVIANKVQDEHGAWRSLDSRTLHQAAVFASELYDDLVADHLAARLPVRWSWRDRGERRTPAFEVDGVSDKVLAAFSTRSADIDIAVQRAVKDFTLSHGRRPNRREVVRLRQTATLETRPTKKPHSLSELTARWTVTARRAAGREPVEITEAMLMGHDRRRLRNDRVGDVTVTRLANAAVADVMERRSTWTDWNLLASAARVTRGLRMVSTAHRLALVDRVHTEAQRLSTRLDPDDPVRVTPELTRPDGASIFTRAGETRYSHPQLLAAEHRLLDANASTDGPRVPEPTARRVLASIAINGLGSRPRLATDQAAAIHELATSGRALDVLVGPAGTGKTTTLLGLRIAWESVHGQGSVVGLAPSATAAHELAAALGIHCENVAKWLTETAPARQAERDELLADIPTRRAAALANGDIAHVRRLDHLGARLQADRDAWTLRPGQLMVVDEASLAGTLDLDRLREQATGAGAKLLLVGDHAQLSAVDAGGAFRLLARTANKAELTSLWRFQHRWEADASLRLRRGDIGAIDMYDAHGRIHGGPAESMLDHAYDAWAADERAGHTTLLIAPDNRTAVALNERAHLDRIADGSVTGPTVGLGAPGCGPDRGHVGVGDRVITRHNDRSLSVPGHGHVRNGDLWTVTAVQPDGSLDVTAARDPGRSPTRLPATYVAQHVDLGYATTAHRAQGATVDRCHVLATAGTPREALYVAMTRGREANTVYVATDGVEPDCAKPDTTQLDITAREALVRIVAADAAERSATETAQNADAATRSLQRLGPIRATIASTIDHRRWPARLTSVGLPADTVKRIVGSPAAGALFAALRRGEGMGHAMDRVAVGLYNDRPLPPEGDAAALLHHRVETWLATAPTLVQAVHSPANALGLREGAPLRGSDPLDSTLEAVDALIDSRVAQLVDEAISERPSWLPSLPAAVDDTVARDVAVLATHRDLIAGKPPQPTVPSDSRHDQQQQRTAELAHTRLSATFEGTTR